MKNYILVFSFLISYNFVYSQEICNNGIDDNANGLVDLNDPGCACSGIGGGGTPSSLIPNPSFETTNCCPTTFSELNCAGSWVQASDATSDYFNCGYNFNAATAAGISAPDGTGYVGAIVSPGYIEYVGSCLSSPLVAGTSYTFQMEMASSPIDGWGDVCNGGAIFYSPMNLTYYGSPNCTSLPFSGYDCPTNSGSGSDWQVLGSTSYTPSATWGVVTVTFTPSVNINAIIFGAPCTLPADYSNACYPYFYFDNLILNNSTLFDPVTVAQIGGSSAGGGSPGTLCTGDAAAQGTASTAGGTWQWYFNNVAIVGQTSDILDVSATGLGAGDYTAVYTVGGQCDASTTTYTNGSANPTITPAGPFCSTSGSQNLSAVTTGGTWTASCGICIDSVTGQFDPSIATIGNNMITYTLTGACAAVDTETIVVESTSISDTIVTDLLCAGICNGQIVINSTGATQFSVNGGTTFQASNTFSNLCSGTYNIVIETATAGCQATTTATIQTPITLTLPTSFVDESCFGSCDGSVIVAPQGGTSPYDYVWSNGAANSPTNNNLCLGTYNVTVTDDNGCTGTASITVSSPPQVVISGIVTTDETCAGNCDGSITINSPSSIQFSIDNGATFSASNVFLGICQGVHQVITIDANGCQNTGVATVGVSSIMPVANFTFGPQPTDYYNSEITFLNLSSNANSYNWDFGTFGTSSQFNPSPILYPDSIPGNYTVCLIAVSSGNCSDTICANVIIDDVFILYVPNSFTPDNDGINDSFFPVISGMDPASYQLMIFNRWGEIIFESTQPGGAWEGREKGLDCKVDTYVWKLVVKDPQLGKKRFFYGHVNLVR